MPSHGRTAGKRPLPPSVSRFRQIRALTKGRKLSKLAVAGCVPVAQLDRALASGAKGRRFESFRARQISLSMNVFRASLKNRAGLASKESWPGFMRILRSKFRRKATSCSGCFTVLTSPPMSSTIQGTFAKGFRGSPCRWSYPKRGTRRGSRPFSGSDTAAEGG